MYRVPSLKSLVDNFPQADVTELERFRHLAKIGKRDAALHKADSAIAGYGACTIRHPELGLLALYVNTGDTYSATILWDSTRGAWRITTWGDWIETFERRHGRKASESLSAY